MWMKGAEGTKPLAKSPFFGCVSAGTKNGKAVRARHEDKVRLLLRTFWIGSQKVPDHQFCCEACQEAYKEKRSQIAAEFKAGFHHSLTNSA